MNKWVCKFWEVYFREGAYEDEENFIADRCCFMRRNHCHGPVCLMMKVPWEALCRE